MIWGGKPNLSVWKPCACETVLTPEIPPRNAQPALIIPLNPIVLADINHSNPYILTVELAALDIDTIFTHCHTQILHGENSTSLTTTLATASKAWTRDS